MIYFKARDILINDQKYYITRRRDENKGWCLEILKYENPDKTRLIDFLFNTETVALIPFKSIPEDKFIEDYVMEVIKKYEAKQKLEEKRQNNFESFLNKHSV